MLRNVSWQVNRREHCVILGANGSGKTSLLASLTGYLTPSAGDIDLLGQRFGETDWSELRKHIGVVSSSLRQMMADTEPALYTVASGKYAMIDFWGDPKPADLAAAKKILRSMECEYLADREWRMLSQGERQRVLIGRALMAKPSLLILDEPCAGLDPVAREKFLKFIDRLGVQKNAPTLVFVTHHVEEIRSIFSHAMLLRAGEVLASGPIEEVLNSKKLTQTFGARVKLRRSGTGWALEVDSA